MRRVFVLLGCGLLLAPSVARAQQTDSGTAVSDSAFARAQRLVAEGQGDSGRAIIQRELDAAPFGSPRYVEALYWRAVVAATAADAERDLRRIVVEYPVSPWSADALMRLAQLEMTRGENDQALGHLERVVTEHPESPARARANFWMARVLFEQGNPPRACARLADAVRLTPTSNVEMRNQLEYLNQRCMGVDTTAVVATKPAPASGASRAATPPAPPRRMTPATAAQQSAPPSPTPPRTSSAQPAARQYTVQVAAYSSKPAAEELRARLATQGFDARVVGTSAPYRVRVGRYDTREAAEGMAQRMKGKNMSVMVTEAEGR
jgi:cell division septation protein DedD